MNEAEARDAGVHMDTGSRQRLVAALDSAVRWLLESGVRTPDGGFRSIYRPATREYATYGMGLSCLQCTAGGVLALLAAAKGPSSVGPGAADCLASAVESADHILALMRGGHGPEEGMIPCGLSADTVKTLHTEAAIRAFLEVHEATGDERWLLAARSAARLVIKVLLRPDGSLRSGSAMSLASRFKIRLFDVAQTGAAAYVRTLRRLARLTGDRTLGEAASRILAWLRRHLDDEGGLHMYRYRLLSRLIASRYYGGAAEFWRGCLRYHPSPNAWMIEALLEDGDAGGARKVSQWFIPRLGPNGLAYQYYFRSDVGAAARGRGANAPGGIVAAAYGAHSVEEDVMPTASVALQWLARPDIVPGANAEALLARVASGIVNAQASGGGASVEGGVRGLPLHPAFNDDIYTWDTVYAVLFLTAYLQHERGDTGGGAP